jgi:hypothetical protein
VAERVKRALVQAVLAEEPLELMEHLLASGPCHACAAATNSLFFGLTSAEAAGSRSGAASLTQRPAGVSSPRDQCDRAPVGPPS